MKEKNPKRLIFILVSYFFLLGNWNKFDAWESFFLNHTQLKIQLKLSKAKMESAVMI